VAQDLQSICLEEIANIKLVWTDVTVPATGFHHKEGQFRIAYPSGAYNDNAKMGYEVSPLGIGEDYNPDGPHWFATLHFNGAAFVRKDGKRILRENWREYANDVSNSIDASVARMPDFNGHSMTFQEWCEDMIIDFGDEVAPQLQSIWQEIQSNKGNA